MLDCISSSIYWCLHVHFSSHCAGAARLHRQHKSPSHTHYVHFSRCVCVLTYSIESQSGTQCKRTAVLLIKHILIHLLYNLACSFCVCSDDCVSLIESTENTARSFFLLCLVIKKKGYICLPGESLLVQPVYSYLWSVRVFTSNNNLTLQITALCMLKSSFLVTVYFRWDPDGKMWSLNASKVTSSPCCCFTRTLMAVLW